MRSCCEMSALRRARRRHHGHNIRATDTPCLKGIATGDAIEKQTETPKSIGHARALWTSRSQNLLKKNHEI